MQRNIQFNPEPEVCWDDCLLIFEALDVRAVAKCHVRAGKTFVFSTYERLTDTIYKKTQMDAVPISL